MLMGGAQRSWLAPRRACRGGGRSMEMDPETMKLALRITFAAQDEALQELFKRVQKRPWYARHLKVNAREV